MPDTFPIARFRARSLRSGEIVPYVPTAVQRRFHESQAKYRGFVAGVGSGKSYCCCCETLHAAILNPGSVNAVVRWDQTSLKDTTWRLLEEVIEMSGLSCLVKTQQNNNAGSRIEFQNGSIIQGYHAKSWERFGSLSLSSFFIDEVGEIDEPDSFNQLCTRVSRHHIGPNRGWVAGIPDGQGWYWEKFIAKKLPNHEHFAASTFDNPFVALGYAEELISIHGKELAQMLIMGSFDPVEGRLWSIFNRDLHVLRRTATPYQWPRYCGVDPGFGCDPSNSTDSVNKGDPCAAVRIVADPYGNLIVEAEYERYDRLTEQFSADILSINEALPPQFYVMDCSAFRSDHRARFTVEETARRAGMSPLIEAKNTAGYLTHAVQRVRSLLTPQPGRIHPVTREEGCFPALYFFEDCIKTIHQVETCRRKKQGAASAANEIKLPDHGHDMVDCIFFLLLENMQPADKAVTAGDPRTQYRTLTLPDFDDEPAKPYLETISRIGSFRR